MTRGNVMTNGMMVKLSTLVPGDTFETSDGDRILLTPQSAGTFFWARLTDGATGGTTDGQMLVKKTDLKYTSV